MYKKVLIGCGVAMGCLVVSILALLIAIGIALEAGFLPDSVALPKGKIHPRYIEQLRSNEIISETEEVYFFYSDSLTSILEDGNLFTAERVISYQSSPDGFQIYSAEYSEIESIDFKKSTDWAGNSLITVALKEGDGFYLIVANDSNMDEEFNKKLQLTWRGKVEK